MGKASEDQRTIYETTHQTSFHCIHFWSTVLSLLHFSRKICTYFVIMCSPSLNSLNIAPKFSIVIRFLIVDLKISLYLQIKFSFHTYSWWRKHNPLPKNCTFNHDETMERVQYTCQSNNTPSSHTFTITFHRVRLQLTLTLTCLHNEISPRSRIVHN